MSRICTESLDAGFFDGATAADFLLRQEPDEDEEEEEDDQEDDDEDDEDGSDDGYSE